MSDRKTVPQSIPGTNVESFIRTIRGERVILDSDLARLYGVTTKRLNEQAQRNQERFPSDFMFQLTVAEQDGLRSQFATLNKNSPEKRRGQHRKYLPRAFTEHGAIMAANVLNSPQAVQMSVFVVRAFIKMRGIMSDTQPLAIKLAALEAELRSRLDVQESAIVDILQRVMEILDPPPQPPRPEPPRRQIGFHAKAEATQRTNA